MKRKVFFAIVLMSLFFSSAYSQGPGQAGYIIDRSEKGYFPLVADGKAAPILLSQDEWPGVRRATNSFINDIRSVADVIPLLPDRLEGSRRLIIAGTLGRNQWIDRLVKQGRINVDSIAGKWETYLIQSVQKPFPGVEEVLIIAGSDKRGTIYGIYDMSAQIGVSPWYWWADVPPKKKRAIYVKPGRHTDGTPAVKYRGIFINDEAPAFSGWTTAKFGGFNHGMYEKVFELLLRLKANYLWPAMWGRAFNDDDKLNPVLADEYGIVMGTSHHEPMNRAQQEWKLYGKGEWNYETNKDVLEKFWRKGIENMGAKETIVTVGMRGDGDMPMTEGSNITLLERIVKDQRAIINDVLKKDASEVPQMWALYKEVQDYYDKGMRVPDDVTLLLCDDNWGNIRKLPSLTEKPRKGGYGIYYHFDYVGGPRSYKWINTNSVSRIWEQMHLAYEYNARQLWVVNVGDLKPMEYPISFFLDYAWKPERWTADKLRNYSIEWAAQQFGNHHAAEIADILIAYTRYNSRCKPELLNEKTFSLLNYNEFFRVTSDYRLLEDRAKKLYEVLPANYRDAFYQLVLHPVQASANLTEMYLETAKNKYYIQKGNAAAANEAADKVKVLFDKDQRISDYYNNQLAGGKWKHMMDQTHIGYVSWSDPANNVMPAVTRLNPDSTKNTTSLPLYTTNLTAGKPDIFKDEHGYIAIEAEHFSRAVGNGEIRWTVIPDYGNTLSGVTPWPVTSARVKTGLKTPHLEYDIDLKDSGIVSIITCVSPTLDFKHQNGLFYAVSIDDEQPQMVDISTRVDSRQWETSVIGNIRKLTTRHKIGSPGKHVLKYWMVDPAVVLQKIMIDSGGLKESFLGPVYKAETER
ncbi:glycosyl hydrolase 115 family protein [Arcticibacter tournemirensis]